MNSMKLLSEYLKHHLYLYFTAVFFGAIFAVTFLLYRLPLEAVIYPFLLCIALGIILSAADFNRVKRNHALLKRIKNIEDAAENSLPEAKSIEAEDYREIIRLMGEEHGRYRTETVKEYSDTVDYYTVWAHQIKTPIASMRLNLQNEDSPLSRKLYTDLQRIEQYVEMVLTFLRLNSESSDYVIREYDLDEIVKQAVEKFSYDFIGRKLSLVYEPLNTKVITDEKWLSVVIEQILSNALKYTQSGKITISVTPDKKLSVRDTGMGIAPEDLPRIFENGYTGFNGRTDKRASGIGLYLCKRICGNLGHGISAKSTVDKGTQITLDLAQRKPESE